MANCIMCNKKLLAGQRADTKYCSQACRSKAYHSRRKNLLRLQAGGLDAFQQHDLQVLQKQCTTAASFVAKVLAVTDAKFANEALDAFWELAFACGCNLAERITPKNG